MQLLKTSKCCGCMNLRTGGLVIGYLYLFSSFSNIELFGASGIAPCVANILAYGAWIYGIMNNRTSWMLPGLILSVIGMVTILLNLIGIPIFGTVFHKEIVTFVAKMAQMEGDDDSQIDSAVTTILTILWIIFAISAAIHWHFMAVQFSLYRSMKQEEFNPTAPYLAEAGEFQKRPPPPPY